MILSRSRLATVLRAAAPVVLVVLVAAILLRFPPTEDSFYPHCPIYAYLHIQCPGCGGTRALAALLRGHIVEALRLNALTTLMLPVAFAYGCVCYRNLFRGKRLRLPQPSAATIYAGFVIAGVFTILRNLPLRPL
jgi:hypothetical protein